MYCAVSLITDGANLEPGRKLLVVSMGSPTITKGDAGLLNPAKVLLFSLRNNSLLSAMSRSFLSRLYAYLV